MRSKQAVTHRRTPCGGEQAGKERADERAGFRGHAQVDDFQSQSIGDGAEGGGDPEADDPFTPADQPPQE